MTPEQARDTCATLLHDRELTDWEREFVTSLLARLAPLTLRQRDVLLDLARKYHVAFGLTVSEDDLWR